MSKAFISALTVEKLKYQNLRVRNKGFVHFRRRWKQLYEEILNGKMLVLRRATKIIAS